MYFVLELEAKNLWSTKRNENKLKLASVIVCQMNLLFFVPCRRWIRSIYSSCSATVFGSLICITGSQPAFCWSLYSRWQFRSMKFVRSVRNLTSIESVCVRYIQVNFEHSNRGLQSSQTVFHSSIQCSGRTVGDREYESPHRNLQKVVYLRARRNS